MSKVPTQLLVYPQMTRWNPKEGMLFKDSQWIQDRLVEATFIFCGEQFLVQQWMEYVIGLPSVIEYGDRPEAIAA